MQRTSCHLPRWGRGPVLSCRLCAREAAWNSSSPRTAFSHDRAGLRQGLVSTKGHQAGRCEHGHQCCRRVCTPTARGLPLTHVQAHSVPRGNTPCAQRQLTHPLSYPVLRPPPMLHLPGWLERGPRLQQDGSLFPSMYSLTLQVDVPVTPHKSRELCCSKGSPSAQTGNNRRGGADARRGCFPSLFPLNACRGFIHDLRPMQLEWVLEGLLGSADKHLSWHGSSNGCAGTSPSSAIPQTHHPAWKEEHTTRRGRTQPEPDARTPPVWQALLPGTGWGWRSGQGQEASGNAACMQDGGHRP